MKSTKMLTILALGLMTWLVGFTEAAPMGTAWTYQGRLIDANSAADGLYDFQFKLFDANVAGTQQGSIIEANDLDVISGYFTAELDFGSSVFSGDARWLEILVRPGDSIDAGDYVTLSPRHEISPTPYALQTRGIFVDSTGNVGIGNTSPGSPLDVTGQIRAASLKGHPSMLAIESPLDIEFTIDSENSPSIFSFFELFNGTGSNLWFVNENGDMRVTGDAFLDGSVGIGTFTPEQKLHVLGGIKISDADAAIYFDETSGGASDNWLAGAFEGDFRIGQRNTTVGNRFLIQNGGNVGIGTTAPSSKLHIEGNTTGEVSMKIHNLNNTGTERLYFGTNTSDAGMIVWGSSNASYPGKWRFFNNKTSANFDWITSGSTTMTLANNGNLGIGTTSPTAKLDVLNSSELMSAQIINSSSSGVAYGVNVLANGAGGTGHYAGRFSASGATNNYAIYADGTNSKSYFSGNVGIGTTNPSYKLHVVGSAAKTTGIYWTSISDRRLKKNIKPLEGALDRLTRLQGRTFTWKDARDLNASEGTHIGLVAQEVEEVFPQWVSEDNQGRKQVTLEGLEAVTIEAIKELKAENELLRKRLEILEERLNGRQFAINKEVQ
ncbi:MAG: hypothetical protein FVQ85_03175 [Planctomycetes bacterium]|nr:hypothetical protein [Planctomycetota bacterium]